MTTQAFSFIRWSKPEQAKGDTLRRQKADSESLCKRHKWALTELPPLEGKSAFRGKQRQLGSLAEFVRRAEAGELPTGSVLIVESLDRLSREQVRTATKFFLSILDAGISIATTVPEYVYRHDNCDMQDILIAVVTLARGHEESATKSRRVGEAWADKRARAKTEKLTKMCPSWLVLKEDRSAFEIIEEKANVVRRIFKMCIDGYGVWRIAHILNEEKVPTLSGKKRNGKGWYESYIIRILGNRSVLGELQPCTRNDKNQSVKVGDPIPNYYPAIISEADFTKARLATQSRALNCKRTGAATPNLFGKLIKNARDGLGFLYIPAKKKSPLTRLEPVGGRAGVSKPLSMRYGEFEDAFLRFLTEVSVDEMIGKPKVSKADEIEAKLNDIKKRIGILEGRMKTDPDLESLLDRLAQWKGEKRELEQQLELERNPTNEGQVLNDAKDIIKLLKDNPEHHRTKLRQMIAFLVSEIWLLVYERRAIGTRDREMTERAAVVQIHFKTGTARTICIQKGVLAATEEVTPEDLRTLREDKAAMKKYDKPLPLPTAEETQAGFARLGLFQD